MAFKQMMDAEYPPDAQTASELNNNQHVEAWGVYLRDKYASYREAPFQSPTSWTPRLVNEYVSKGIKEFMPIYVGQQKGPSFNEDGVFSRKQGVTDAIHAVTLAKAFGWTRGYIALDIENETADNVESRKLFDYYSAWLGTVGKMGYWGGVYCPISLAEKMMGTKCCFLWIPAWRGTGEIQEGLNPDLVPGVRHNIWPHHRIHQYDTGNIRTYAVDFDSYNFLLNPPPKKININNTGKHPKHTPKPKGPKWFGHTIKDVPVLNQLALDNWDAQSYYDCGPTCVDMAVKYYTGMHFDPQAEVNSYYGDGYVGDTDFSFLEYILGLFRFPYRYVYTATKHDMDNFLNSAFKNSHLVIGLFYFNEPGVGGHFRLLYGTYYAMKQSKRYYQTIDPYNPDPYDPTGPNPFWDQSSDDLWNWSQNGFIEILRRK